MDTIMGTTSQPPLPDINRELYVPLAEFQALQARCEKLEEENRLYRTLISTKSELYVPLADFQALQAENAELKKENQLLREQIKTLSDEVQQLKELFKLSQLARFGKKSEIGETICSTEDTNGQSSGQEPVHVCAHTRGHPNTERGNKNKDLLKLNIPRYTVIYDLFGEDLKCKNCHELMSYIGDDESLQLDLLPSLLYLREQIQSKYACKKCNAIVMPKKELSPIPKARAGASLITEVIVNKFERHLPLYRQSQMFHTMGVDIGDNTLGRWTMQIGEALLPLYELMWELLLKERYVQIDETAINVLNPNRKGYLWCYYVRFANSKGLILYDFHIDRSSSIPSERLKGYKGLIQTDGYNGYNELGEREDITRLGCLTHARRKFTNVLKITKNKTGIAAEAVQRLKPLYAIEQFARDHKLSFRNRKRLRMKKSLPILLEFKHWVKSVKPSVPPKSQLGLAIQYFLDKWRYIIQYVHHGIAEIDTNIVENLIRPTAIGKKNFLFFHHAESGAINGMLYSFVQSCLLNGLEPRTYINYLLTKVHDIRRKTVDLQSLLPHMIEPDVLKVFAQQQIQLNREILNNIRAPPTK